MKLYSKFYLENIKGKVVLSLGFLGEGENEARQLNIIHDNVKELYAMDIGVTDEIKKKYEHLANGIYFADLNVLDFLDQIPAKVMKKIDIILLTEVLEHLLSPINTLEYIAKKKSKNTKILLSVPNGASFGRFIKSILSRNWLFNTEDSLHNCVFSRRSISNVVKKSGLEIEKTYSYTHSKLLRILTFPFSEIGSGFFLIVK